ncbi:MAG: insulinase family protein, partial [Candidatus Cloacimonetes bacterium]|nr:insulinase family protein [Candidatus Cloacimonadota bacterium]
MPGLHIQPAESFVLPNSLKVILHKDLSEPIVCLQAVVRSGSANERAPEAGFSHFIEHLAFKSSKRYGFNQISSTVSRLGGSLNAYTDFDSTCYYLLL